MHGKDSTARFRFLFLSSNNGWGGSEELWSSTAERLAVDGHAVAASVGWSDTGEARLSRLRELGCSVRGTWAPRKLPGFGHPFMAGATTRLGLLMQFWKLRLTSFWLKRFDLVVISQGANFDGIPLAGICRRQGIPYVLISQKASEMKWPTDRMLPGARQAYLDARRCFFVSLHNWRLTEEQLGVRLPNAALARNPFRAPWRWDGAWPDAATGYRLACVARLEPGEKGQDLLLRVLARPKWRGRPLTLSLFGAGCQQAGLMGLAKLLDLPSVSFQGFVHDVSSIWATHHALALPSRAEGLPLVIVEAMLHGRLPIVTNVAGNGEVIEDGRTGFLAAAPTEDALDAALEKAWAGRDQWQAMGAAAALAIRELVPMDPAGVLAGMLLELANTSRAVALPVPGRASPAGESVR